MRSFKHWSVRYLGNRTIDKIYRWKHPTRPWLTPKANTFLESLLRKNDVGVEFGAGRSTLWFGAHVEQLVSIESNLTWFNWVKTKLKNGHIHNVKLIYVPPVPDRMTESNKEYLAALEQFGPGSLDFALVDGLHRDECCAALLERIRHGGLLILDDAHRYIPWASSAPLAIGVNGQPATPLWATVWNTLKTWRFIWTSSGVSDTAIFIKPCETVRGNL